ncbi:hypothetical protein KIN20_006358 [Parelaphostrongylus tenuis]|uniref:Uncharacterized protein n=1 Tax=Parelaphostrongylus tenuis TaxID=148309 RepID=A0AAD5M1N3_PARTN|nr:hypothetical protein KIN20_006358 [Parelaphostrongylus tenuis]
MNGVWFSGIATSGASARGTVQRLVTQTENVSSCDEKIILAEAKIDETYCIIVGNLVTGVCTVREDGNKKKCSMPEAMKVTVTAINGAHVTVSETFSVEIAFFMTTLSTSIIMADWSKAMWQSVLTERFECWHQVRLDRTSSQQGRFFGGN